MNKRHVISSICFLALLAFVAALWSMDKSRPDPLQVSHVTVESLSPDAVGGQSPGETAGRELVPLSPPTEAHQSESGAVLPPMPPIDTPLEEQLDDLIALAKAGDPVAACRLALEGQTCRARQRSAEFRRHMERSLIAGPGVEREELMINALAAEDAGGASGEHYCESVALERLPSLERSLRQALHNLTPRQKVLLALTRQDGTLRRIPHAMPEGVTRSSYTTHIFPQILADNLVGFLHAGLAAADPLALEGLILLHAPSLLPGNAPEHGMHLPDPLKFSIYASLMAQLFGPAALGPQVEYLLGASMATLTLEEHGRLVRMLEQEEQRWLAVSTADRGLELPSATNRTARLCED